jgi:hypothetical protein
VGGGGGVGGAHLHRGEVAQDIQIIFIPFQSLHKATHRLSVVHIATMHRAQHMPSNLALHVGFQRAAGQLQRLLFLAAAVQAHGLKRHRLSVIRHLLQDVVTQPESPLEVAALVKAVHLLEGRCLLANKSLLAGGHSSCCKRRLG